MTKKENNSSSSGKDIQKTKYGNDKINVQNRQEKGFYKRKSVKKMIMIIIKHGI